MAAVASRYSNHEAHTSKRDRTMACMISVGAYRKNAARGEKRMDGILEDQSNEQNKTGIMKH